MKVHLLYPIILFVFLSSRVCLAQEIGFPFGQVTFRELSMTSYDKDTTAAAVVLNEFGNAYIDQHSFNLIFEYHVRIKILKAEGLSRGDYSIPLYKGSGDKRELLLTIKASTFNIENSAIADAKLDERKIYVEDVNKNWSVKKFALPKVQVGSVVEIQYTLESPFIFNFRRWEFQDDIPKMYSEYWTTIPGNYQYNITLKGFLNLTKNQSSIVNQCISYGSSYGSVYADCSFNKYGMKDIPAFVEEDYMTAKVNYLSSINFELSEIRHFDGRVDKFTKEWKDAEIELRREQRFGVQLKKGKDIGQKIQELIAGVNDPKEKALKVYTFIKTWYKWNDTYGYYSENGIKKAFDTKVGNVGDINLSLIAALNFAELNVEPILLSTRSNGIPVELHPVLSDFNYVVAKLNIADKVYLLDATDPYLMFGMLPEKCLNGKGRVFSEKGSYWYDLKPIHKDKTITLLNLHLTPSGTFTGTLENFYEGYSSVEQRKKINSFPSADAYIADLVKKQDHIQIEKFNLSHVEDIEMPIREVFNVTIDGFDNLNAKNLLLNPFFTGKISKNPFQTTTRLFPVDYGIPLDRTIILTLTTPEDLELISKPESVALSLPGAGGKFIFDIVVDENKFTMSYLLSINKTFFTVTEYHYLRELYSRIIQVQHADMIFSRKESR